MKESCRVCTRRLLVLQQILPLTLSPVRGEVPAAAAASGRASGFWRRPGPAPGSRTGGAPRPIVAVKDLRLPEGLSRIGCDTGQVSEIAVDTKQPPKHIDVQGNRQSVHRGASLQSRTCGCQRASCACLRHRPGKETDAHTKQELQAKTCNKCGVKHWAYGCRRPACTSHSCEAGQMCRMSFRRSKRQPRETQSPSRASSACACHTSKVNHMDKQLERECRCAS